MRIIAIDLLTFVVMKVADGFMEHLHDVIIVVNVIRVLLQILNSPSHVIHG